LPARAREMAKYIVETPEQAALHGEQWIAVNKLVKLTLEQSQREVLNVKATAGVGLVLDSTMDGTLHIIEVVPGGAGALRCPSCCSTLVLLSPPAECLTPALIGLCAGLWVAAAAQDGRIQRVPPARPQHARATPHPRVAEPRLCTHVPSSGSLISRRSSLRVPARAGMRRATSCSV